MLKTKCFSCGKDIIKKDENKVNFYGVLREDVPEQNLKKGDRIYFCRQCLKKVVIKEKFEA